MYNLGLILRTLRTKHGYNQKTISKKLNVSLSTIGRWENNEIKPSTQKLIELAFNTSINYLIGIPLEDTLSIESLTPDQQHILLGIVAHFKPAGAKLTEEQKQIINALLDEFS